MFTRHPLSIGLAALALAGGLAHAQTPATASRTKAHVEMLASDQFDGRLTGSKGEQLAGNYLVAQLKRLGAKPLPGATDFRTAFTFTAGSKDGGSTVSVSREGQAAQAFASGDVRALSFSDNGETSGSVVFAGYGLVVPASQNFGYDSYAGLDVKDKIVLVLRYFPEDADQQTRAILARYADLRYKAQAARQRGAKGLVVLTGPRSPNAGEMVPMSFDTAIAGSGIVAASISGAAGKALFAAVPGKTIDDVQKELDGGNPHVAGFAIPGVTVSIHATVVREQQTGHNVLAYFPATAPAPATDKPWVAIGAHYDHLGRGTTGGSLASKDDAGKIHHGADDNASGTAAVLAMAESLARQPRKRNLLVAFWSGEELGTLGSLAFVNAPPIPLAQIAAYLNFDMVGRVHDNKLTVQATGTSAIWPKVLEQANVLAGFDLVLQEDPYQPTDVSSFNLASVACLTFFTGAHQEYHKPSDTADLVNYEDLDRVVDFATAVVKRLSDLDTAPLFTKVEAKTETGGRAGLRLFTGTIPDYATDVKGLLLGGVVGGGPADQAGLQKGDVIVEISGQSITNIYDYTFALELLKIGQPAKVVYMRGTDKRETTLTPAARK